MPSRNSRLRSKTSRQATNNRIQPISSRRKTTRSGQLSKRKKRVRKIGQRLGNGKSRLANVRQVNVASKVHNKRYEMIRLCATVASCVLHVPARMTAEEQ